MKKLLLHIRDCFIFAMLLSSIAGLSYISFVVGQRHGVEVGRSEYHRELINELQAKGGAPVLLYPDPSWGAVND